MRKILLLFALPLLFTSFTKPGKKELTREERKFAVDHLNETRADLMAAVQGLSEAQLNYKPSPDRWSVLECVQHITLASHGLYEMMQQTVVTSNDSSWTSTVTDTGFIRSVEDRSRKAQAAEPLKPYNSPDKDLASTLKTFNAGRDSLIRFVDTTHGDLRAHIANLGFAKVDAYQIILLISAHTNRHTQQLNEVKASAGFPEH